MTRNNSKSRLLAFVVAFCAMALVLTACGGSGDDGGNATEGKAASYEDYAFAYNKISENGGVDADLDVTLTMDGTTNNYTGNFKIDSVNNLMYYEMTSDGKTTTQFSDGEYLYIERDGQKIKQSISGGSSSAGDMPSQQGGEQQPPANGEGPEAPEAPEFDSSKYLDEFSSFLDAGKIKEMGLLNSVPKLAVSSVTENNGVYSLEIADSLAETFINNMATEQAGNDTVQVEDMKDFKYTATIKDGIVVGTTYSGSVTVKVPASLTQDGKDAEYPLDFNIKIDFNNPGETVSISLPDTADFKEVSGK